ncbi:MAG: trypsin-like peptidase domain-containing protein [Pirellulales bacterium]|nr:trypsin-like peptidase domain-containing protein [Pirellulales bacterium]
MVWKRSKHVLALASSLLALGIYPAGAETVLLDFNSATCRPCQQMRPVVRGLVSAGYEVRDIDIQRKPQIANQFGIVKVPTFVVLVDGRETDRVVGPASFARLEQMLARSSAHPTSSPLHTVTHENRAGSQTREPAQPLVGPVVQIEGPAVAAGSGDAAAGPVPDRPGAPPALLKSASTEQRALIEASVKITVDDPKGKSAGTGTLVDARQGEALVLTCGHLFRESGGQGQITVTLFHQTPQGVQPGASFSGKLIEVDLERDLGLVSIRPNVQVQPVKIATRSGSLPPGSRVTSIGCDRGAAPSARQSQVTANNRYQGPGNIEVAGAPVDGRSGGGLFNESGELVGVCFAADHQDDEGLYASLRSVHAKFDSLGLSAIYLGPAVKTPTRPAQLQQGPQVAATPSPGFSVRGQEPAQIPTSESGVMIQTGPPSLRPVEQAAWEEIQRRGANSEVICIIRPHDPAGKSEVITLNNASPEFVRELKRPRAVPGGTASSPPATAAVVERLLR